MGSCICLPRQGDDTADVRVMQAKVLPNLLPCLATAGVGGRDCLVAIRVPLGLLAEGLGRQPALGARNARQIAVRWQRPTNTLDKRALIISPTTIPVILAGCRNPAPWTVALGYSSGSRCRRPLSRRGSGGRLALPGTGSRHPAGTTACGDSDRSVRAWLPGRNHDRGRQTPPSQERPDALAAPKDWPGTSPRPRSGDSAQPPPARCPQTPTASNPWATSLGKVPRQSRHGS